MQQGSRSGSCNPVCEYEILKALSMALSTGHASPSVPSPLGGSPLNLQHDTNSFILDMKAVYLMNSEIRFAIFLKIGYLYQ